MSLCYPLISICFALATIVSGVRVSQFTATHCSLVLIEHTVFRSRVRSPFPYDLKYYENTIHPTMDEYYK